MASVFAAATAALPSPAPSPANVLLEVETVSRRFGGLTAVDSVSLQITPGELVALVGPNGAGKSTLLQLINGMLHPDSGVLRLNGSDITHLPPEAIALRGISRTFQTSRVFPGLTVWDSVRVGLQPFLRGGDRFGRPVGAAVETLSALLGPPGYRRRQQEIDHKVEEVLRLFGDRLWPHRYDLAQSLSYANRRRLEIARALVADPLLLLLDEPAAGMNPTETAELAKLISRLREQRPSLSIMLVEHKMQFVRRLADRVLVLDQGKLIAAGKPDEVLALPQVVAAYLGSRRLASAPQADQTPASTPASTPTSAAAPAFTTPTPAHGPARPKTRAFLQVEAIDAYYGPLQVLFGVSLHVARGETVVLLGGNASGKSTTVKTVLGLVRPRRGAIYLDGHRIDGLSTARIVELGVGSIPEGRRVFPEMTVEENIMMGAFVRRRQPAAVLRQDFEAALELFPTLSSHLRQPAGTLSGGEQQLVAMARALLRRPQLLCIDEPSMGLSPLYVERVYEVICSLKRQGITILMVEQSADKALEVADRAYVLRSGQIVLSGPAGELAADEGIRRAYLGEEAIA